MTRTGTRPSPVPAVPEYVKLRPDMTLSEFKYIYFWEYLHRMIGRLIGMAFLVPFLWFWIRGYFNGPLFRRVLVLFALGGLQGLMGWYMVSSGPGGPAVGEPLPPGGAPVAGDDDRRRLRLVRQRSSRPAPRQVAAETRRFMLRAVVGLGRAAGHPDLLGRAGRRAESRIHLRHVPADGWRTAPAECLVEDPWPVNLVDNMATVQWVHRVLATVLLVGAVAFVVKVRRAPALAPSGGGARPSLA